MAERVTVFDEQSEEVEKEVGGAWEDARSVDTSASRSEGGTDAVCLGQYQRHKWDGGESCVRCGASKPARAQTTRAPRTSAVKTGKLENLFATLWLGAGVGVEKLPPTLLGFNIPGAKPRVDPETDEVISAAPTQAVGRALQIEAQVAGKRLDRAFARHPAYAIVSKWLAPAGAAADVLPLFAAPMLAGVMAANPGMASRMRMLLVMALVPVLAEQAAMTSEQSALMSQLEGATNETLEQAMRIVDGLLKVGDDE